jgi:hypothetical protein
MTDPRYPIGQFEFPPAYGAADRSRSIERIAATPAKFRAAVHGLSDQQLDTPYRDGGWTIRQVVHHVPDSHLNAYLRIKLALTEDHPTIKPYYEDRWAELPDSKRAVGGSLDLLESLHERWVALLRAMPADGWTRTYYHPENKSDYTIERAVAVYAWHGDHHLAHIDRVRKRKGW